MAERPIFLPRASGSHLVKELSFNFDWNPGFAPVQKKKNVRALHEAAHAQGYSPLLEISTKSDEPIGRRLSAFSLKVQSREHGKIPLECAFQGSKVFEKGGPFTDLYSVEPSLAKRDPRIRSSGGLIEFQFESLTFPIEPKTAFYDWLYITALLPHRDFLSCLKKYVGFTDIEFNPAKSINCQARSCAIFVSLISRGILETSTKSPAAFIKTITPNSVGLHHLPREPQARLF